MHVEWKVLQRTITNVAERCAGSDPPNAELYRREADLFCRMLPPANADELTCLRGDADLLRKRWDARLSEARTVAAG